MYAVIDESGYVNDGFEKREKAIAKCNAMNRSCGCGQNADGTQPKPIFFIAKISTSDIDMCGQITPPSFREKMLANR